MNLFLKYKKEYFKYRHYFELYNSSENKIKVLETLSNIQAKFKERQDDLVDNIDAEIDDIEFYLDYEIDKYHKKNIIDSKKKSWLYVKYCG